MNLQPTLWIARRAGALAMALLAFASASASARTAIPPELRPQGLFEQNLGQFAGDFLYRARVGGLSASVDRDGGLSLYVPASRNAAFRIGHAGASAPKSIEAESPVPYRTNYFRSDNPPVVDVPHFRRVVLRQIYPGIDIAYHARDGVLEFDYELAPGANPSLIVAVVAGATALSLDDSGDLLMQAKDGSVRQRKPVAYQLINGKRREIECAYRLAGSQVTLALGPYDKSRALVIDPVVEYSSYLGGTGLDLVKGVAIGPDGSLYVVGSTTSTNFPVVNAYDATLGGTSDAFVAKINPVTGKAVFSTYVGNSNPDYGMALAVDAGNAIYFTGIPGARFPTTTGAYQTSATGSYGFVAKIAAAGNVLTYSTLLAGTQPRSIAVDSQGRAVVTGTAGTSFLTTTGAYQTAFGGFPGSPAGAAGDAFALMLNAAGSAAVFASFVGGNGNDEGKGVAIDSAGRIVIGGTTDSSNFAAAGGFQPSLRGAKDGFIIILAADGRSRVAGTYLGGTDTDGVNGLAIDPFGNIVVAGNTSSGDFPTTNALQPMSSLSPKYQLSGGVLYNRKGFLAKLAPTLASVTFSTYTGGAINCCDTADAVAVDGAGDIYMAGFSRVDKHNLFSSVRPYLLNNVVRSKYDIVNYEGEANYAAAYSRDGQELRFRSYVAGCDFTNAQNPTTCQPVFLAARGSGQILVGGSTLVDWLPIAAANTQPVHKNPGFSTTGFLTRLSFEPPALAISTSNPSPVGGTVATLTAKSFAAGATGSVTFWDGATQIGSAALVEGVARLNVTMTPGVRKLSARWNTATSPTLLIPVVLP